MEQTLLLNQENQCYQHHSQNILYKWYEPITLHYLISECWSLFERYGAPEEFSSHGGPQFTSTKFQSFLKDWGVHNGTSSAGYPQSNEHAELAVKASKRIIIDNISNDSDLNNNKAAQAILLYCNTPLPEFGLSPAQILFHRQLRDHLPTNLKHYTLRKQWLLSGEHKQQQSSS